VSCLDVTIEQESAKIRSRNHLQFPNRLKSGFNLLAGAGGQPEWHDLVRTTFARGG
jgi:hypothetical protein